MKRVILIVLLLKFGGASAEQNLLSDSVRWIKDNLPTSTELALDRSKVKINGYKLRQYQLNISQTLHRDLVFASGISYAKGQLDLGVNEQRFTFKRFTLGPQYSPNHYTVVQASYTFQSAPEFTGAHELQFELPKSRIMAISTAFTEQSDGDLYELVLSRHQWDAMQTNGSFFDNGLVDNKLMLTYTTWF